MRRVTAYGLQIDAEVPLPELLSGDLTVRADVVVRYGPAPEAPEVADTWVHPAPGVAAMLYDGAVALAVRGGAEIAVEVRRPVPEAVERLPVLGGALGHLLHQRGHLVLHADAVQVGGAAIAVVGPRGLGKSTTATALVWAGHALVADDVVAVAADGTVAPGSPWLRVWPDALRAVGVDPEALARVHPEVEKRWLRAPSAASAPVRLAAIYALARGPELAVEPLSGVEAVVELVRHTYGVEALVGAARGENLRRAAALARSVGVWRVTVPEALGGLGALVELLSRA